MVSAKSVEDQLKKIGYARGWNRPETDELETILLPDEEIFECVNGWYEGGFSLLCATNIRVLLIDKKPFKFLNVEDLRFDTINQIDYSHRMFNASICITAGSKSLIFRSYNQPRLRKLISHVQHRIAELKVTGTDRDENDKNKDGSLDIERRFKEFLMSQYEQYRSIKRVSSSQDTPRPEDQQRLVIEAEVSPAADPKEDRTSGGIDPAAFATGVSSDELYEDGVKEVFGKYQEEKVEPAAIKGAPALDMSDPLQQSLSQNPRVFDTNPLKIAYSKLPMILKSKRRKAAASTA